MRPLSLSARDFGILGKMEMGVGCISTYLGFGWCFCFACFFLPGILGGEKTGGMV